MSRFTASEDELLIELVQGHPIIWNLIEKDYKNVVKKDVIWSEIGKMMKRSGVECKTRWKNIKDYYRKQKKEEKNQTTGSAATKRKAGYWERLRFLDIVQEERGTFTNIETSLSEEAVDDVLDIDSTNDLLDTPECNEHSNAAVIQSTKSVNKQDHEGKRETENKYNKKTRRNSSMMDTLKLRQTDREMHRRKIELLLEKKDDEMDLFFKTMAATTKNFTPELKRQAKIKVFNIITELEAQHQGGLTSINYDYSDRSLSTRSNSGAYSLGISTTGNNLMFEGSATSSTVWSNSETNSRGPTPTENNFMFEGSAGSSSVGSHTDGYIGQPPKGTNLTLDGWLPKDN